MAAPRLAHALIFAIDLERMATFYAAALGLVREDSSDPGFVTMRSAGGGVALHQVPAEIAATVEVGAPPQWRDDAAVKLCFEVDDLAGARQAVLDAGGLAKAPWTWAGAEFCDGTDVEGNPLQLIARSTPR